VRLFDLTDGRGRDVLIGSATDGFLVGAIAFSPGGGTLAVSGTHEGEGR
jgi:hypothetical protein